MEKRGSPRADQMSNMRLQEKALDSYATSSRQGVRHGEVEGFDLLSTETPHLRVAVDNVDAV